MLTKGQRINFCLLFLLIGVNLLFLGFKYWEGSLTHWIILLFFIYAMISLLYTLISSVFFEKKRATNKEV